MRRSNKIEILIGWLLLAASPVLAQEPGTGARPEFVQLQQALKVDDTVIVTSEDGSKVRGQLIDISAAQIVLRVDDAQRSIPVLQITQVQQRKNGVLLGALIGAGAGIPFALLIGEYAHNEGASGKAAIIPIALGAAIGMGIDALLWRPRTVYTRVPAKRAGIYPIVDYMRRGVAFSFTF